MTLHLLVPVTSGVKFAKKFVGFNVSSVSPRLCASVLKLTHIEPLFSSYSRDLRGEVSGAVAVVDVDNAHAFSTGVEH